MRKVVVYPGRFQPMLKHHVDVYSALQRQFPDADVFIATSDKVDPKGGSFFNFIEKQSIASAHGISADKVIQVKNPYNKDDYDFDQENTILIFAVGEKDMNRLPTNNIDGETGLNMTKSGKPSYLQSVDRLDNESEPMSNRGYVTLAPTIKSGEEDASASAFRKAFADAPDVEAAKQLYTKQFGEYNDTVFNLIYNKLVRDKMSEQINRLKKLAGLTEDAPVIYTDPDAYGYERGDGGTAFDKSEIPAYDKKKDKVSARAYEPTSPKDAKAAAERPEKAAGSDPASAEFIPFDPEKFGTKHQKMSVTNRFGDKARDNMEDKKDVFFKELMRSPSSMLGEINSRLANDDNSLAVGDRLSSIIRGMPSSGVAGLEDSDKQFVIKLLANAVKNMDLAEPVIEPEMDDELEDSINFDDVRSEYGIEEGDGTEGQCPECDGSGCDHCDDTGMDPAFGNDDAPSQEEIDAHSKEESFDPSMEPGREQVAYDEAMDAFEKGGEAGLAKHLGMSEQELDQEINQWCAEHGKHADDDRDEAIDGVLDEIIGNADWKDHYEAVKETTEITMDLWKQISARKAELMGEDDDEMEPEEAQDTAAEEFGVDPGELNDWLDSQYESVEEAKCGCCGNDPCDCPPDCEGCGSMEETKMSKTAQEYYDLGVEHGKKGTYKNPPYGIGAPALKAYSKGVKAGEAMKNEAVEETTDNAFTAAMAELKKLAGV